MKNKKQLKKRLLAISTSLAILTTYYNIDYPYQPSYEIIAESPDGPFASYSKGLVYIGNRSFLRNLVNLSEDDILIEDQRFNGYDPNMKIYSSYKISDKNIRNEILEIICKYEECYPSPWDRTIESMRLEWLMHNISYFFENQTHRTRDVDLDNNEEEYYDKPLLNKILKI